LTGHARGLKHKKGWTRKGSNVPWCNESGWVGSQSSFNWKRNDLSEVKKVV